VTLERASARETAIRTAAGALCAQLLGVFGIRIGAFVSAIGAVEARLENDHDWETLWATAENDPVRCPDPDASAEMTRLIDKARKERDTLGGSVVVAATGVPAGLGSCMQADRRLDGILMGRLGAIPSVKGVMIGLEGAHLLRGSQVHDAIRLEGEVISRPTNRAGGLEGGISNGEPLVAHVFFKPLSTLLKGLPSVDLASGQEADAAYERSDICAVPRGAVVCEAVMALVITEALIEKLGGDSVEEMQGRFKALCQPSLKDLKAEGKPRKWW
ncbi:MAG: chorismate synthase, partial [Planctomycetota bacterium]